MHTRVIDPSAHADGTDRSPSVDRAYSFADLSDYSFKDRFLIRAADLAFYLVINLIGHTVKFEVEGWENWEAASRDGNIPIYSFWHNRIFLSIYFWRRRGIVVMTSQSFDGEYIARFIQRFGSGAARGRLARRGQLRRMTKGLRSGSRCFAIMGRLKNTVTR